MERTKAREAAMKLFFQMEAQGSFGSDAQSYIAEHMEEYGAMTPNDCAYLFTLGKYLEEHKEEIDALINEYSKTRSTKRLPKPELAIMRLAVCEMRCMDDVPTAVAIDEAVELTKIYGSEDKAPAFVNGVLGSIAREDA